MFFSMKQGMGLSFKAGLSVWEARTIDFLGACLGITNAQTDPPRSTKYFFPGSRFQAACSFKGEKSQVARRLPICATACHAVGESSKNCFKSERIWDITIPLGCDKHLVPALVIAF